MDTSTLFNSLISTASRTGRFDQVAGHEPKSAPGTGVIAALWLNQMQPIQSSGLNVVSVLVEFTFRLHIGMLREPIDSIDPDLLQATTDTYTALIGAYTQGGTLRAIDVFGADSEGLRAQAGYLQLDQKVYRVMDIFVPCVINDTFPEVP